MTAVCIRNEAKRVISTLNCFLNPDLLLLYQIKNPHGSHAGNDRHYYLL
jgi:hypothetical protein